MINSNHIRTTINIFIGTCAFLLGLFVASLVFGQARYVVPCSDRLRLASMDSLTTFVGITEATGNNDGYRVGAMLSHVGLRTGYAWCAATQIAAFDTSRGKEKLPIARSAMANGIYSDAKQRGKLSGVKIVKISDMIVWKHRTSSAGHIERVVNVKLPFVETIGGNTASGDKGSQSNGGGCYHRIRKFGDLGGMVLRGTVGFTPPLPYATRMMEYKFGK